MESIAKQFSAFEEALFAAASLKKPDDATSQKAEEVVFKKLEILIKHPDWKQKSPEIDRLKEKLLRDLTGLASRSDFFSEESQEIVFHTIQAVCSILCSNFMSNEAEQLATSVQAKYAALKSCYDFSSDSKAPVDIELRNKISLINERIDELNQFKHPLAEKCDAFELALNTAIKEQSIDELYDVFDQFQLLIDDPAWGNDNFTSYRGRILQHLLSILDTPNLESETQEFLFNIALTFCQRLSEDEQAIGVASFIDKYTELHMKDTFKRRLEDNFPNFGI